MVSLVDRVTDDVAAIGALNTVLISNGETVGHNTDVTGFGRAFAEGLPGVALDELVLLGAGGAGTAVAHALARLGARRLHVVDPDVVRARALVASVEAAHPDGAVRIVAGPGLAEALAHASGLVNATPIGMADHPGSPVPPDLLRADLWVADIVYRPLTTDLLREAGVRGCRVLSGAGMAVHQAADAFELITGRPADRGAMTRDFDAMVAPELGRTGASPATDEKPSRGRNQR
jgi:shikimate dehydrogenase